MELTICVCDNCGERHELNPDATAHGHAALGRRVPQGWTWIELQYVPRPEADDAPPDGVEPGAAAMRPYAANTLEQIVSTLRDPAVPDDTARAIFTEMMQRFEPLLRQAKRDLLHRHGYGEHVTPEHYQALLCPNCEPNIVRDVDGAKIELKELHGTVLSYPGFPGLAG